MRTYRTATVATLCTLLLAGPAWAQVEITHAKALAGGVTPGDAPGYPVTLSAGGSYKLTGNLAAPDANTLALVITSSYVTLDLNGFYIHGTTACTGTPVTSCSPLGTGIGVDATGRNSIVVRNGQVFAMGSHGLVVGVYSRVEQVIVQSNGGSGIVTGYGSSVSGTVASRNRASGIGSRFDNLVDGNITRGNRSNGIYADGGSVVRGNAAYPG